MFGNNAYGQTAYADTQDEKMNGSICNRTDPVEGRNPITNRTDPVEGRGKNC